MTIPFRRDDADSEELTTADLVRESRPREVSQTETETETDSRGPQSVRSVYGATDLPAPRSVPAVPEATPLFPDRQLQELKVRWEEIQTSFVDEPRAAVEQADGLVASTMQNLASAFAKERADLERQGRLRSPLCFSPKRNASISEAGFRSASQAPQSLVRRKFFDPSRKLTHSNHAGAEDKPGPHHTALKCPLLSGTAVPQPA